MKREVGNLKTKKVALVGGGTGGPTTPLLAITEVLKQDYSDLNLIFIGTKKGPEKFLVEQEGIKFFSIPAAKLRRYFSLQNILDLFILPIAILISIYLLWREKVDVVVGAGSFVAVPVVWAAAILRKKILIHQQDIKTGLANKLSTPFADIITVTFQQQLSNFKNAKLTGNPVRSVILSGSKDKFFEDFGLERNKPLLLAFGGGTGAVFLNNLVKMAAAELIDNGLQILHITGLGKAEDSVFLTKIAKNYVSQEFLSASEMANAYAAADLVLCRAGLATIAELSVLRKPAIVVPMLNSHQEDNAKLLSENNAALVLSEKNLDAKKLTKQILELTDNNEMKNNFSKNIFNLMPHNGAKQISLLVYNLIKNT